MFFEQVRLQTAVCSFLQYQHFVIAGASGPQISCVPFVCRQGRGIYKSANFSTLWKRNSDRHRDPQQRFTKPQTGLYMISAMYSISQHQQSGVCTPVTDIKTPHPNIDRASTGLCLHIGWFTGIHASAFYNTRAESCTTSTAFYRPYGWRAWPARLHSAARWISLCALVFFLRYEFLFCVWLTLTMLHFWSYKLRFYWFHVCAFVENLFAFSWQFFCGFIAWPQGQCCHIIIGHSICH